MKEQQQNFWISKGRRTGYTYNYDHAMGYWMAKRYGFNDYLNNTSVEEKESTEEELFKEVNICLKQVEEKI